MSAVVEAVSDVVGGAFEAVGDIVESVADAAGDVLQFVGDTVGKVVETAVNDPIGTIAKVAAVATGQFELLPVISAVDVVAHGGNIEQALTSAAVSYIAPEVGGAIGSELADTAFGQALADIGESTGIESLPAAVNRGLGTAVTQTGAGILQGQDVGDALSRGLTSGIGAGVGSAVTAEADTGGEGTNTLDKILGRTAGAVTTAELRGKDPYAAGVNAAASGILGAGINATGSGIASLNTDTDTKKAEAETPVTNSGTQLASADTGTVSDVSLSPTEEAIKNMKAEARPQTEEEAALLDQLIKELYPETKADEVTKIDADGNAYDKSGQKIGEAESLGLVQGVDANGKPAWITSTGEIITAAPVSSGNEPVTDMGEMVITAPRDNNQVSASDILGDQAGDYPQQIENRADGSTVVTEFDGTQRIFNVDGTVETIGADGTKTSEDNNGSRTITYDDGSTITIHADGTVTSTESTDTPYTGEEKSSSSSSNSDLGKLSSALLGGATTTTGGTKGGTKTGGGGGTGSTGGFNLGNSAALLGGAALGAGVLAGLNDSGTSSGGDYTVGSSGMGWDVTDPYKVENAVAHGQHFISPIYKAEGGLLSIPIKHMANGGISGNGSIDVSIPLSAGTGMGLEGGGFGFGGPYSTPNPQSNPAIDWGMVAPQQTNNLGAGAGFSTPFQPANIDMGHPAYGQMPYTQPYQNQLGQMKPQYIQPTIDDGNHLSVSQPQNYNADQSNSVNMFAGGGMPIAMNDGGLPSLQADQAILVNAAQKYGLGDDVRVLNKIEALVNQGMNPDEAARLVAGSAKPTQMAMGAPQNRLMASGGISTLGHYSDGGRMLKGPGDGMSDDIPATIAGRQPARLANEEFVIPADVVSHLGNGSSEAGANVLYDMMAKVRKARTGNSKQGKQIHAEKFMPKMRG
jgi:hypothetical protein